MSRHLPHRLDYILIKLCGDKESWLEAIEALGVRPAYYDGCYRAYLGKSHPCWTNATVARFSSKEEMEAWCNRVNRALHDELPEPEKEKA